MSPLSVPICSPIRARIRVLWRIFRSVRNEEEKNQEIKKRNFVRSYLRKWVSLLSHRLMPHVKLRNNIALEAL